MTNSSTTPRRAAWCQQLSVDITSVGHEITIANATRDPHIDEVSDPAHERVRAFRNILLCGCGAHSRVRGGVRDRRLAEPSTVPSASPRILTDFRRAVLSAVDVGTSVETH